MDPSADPRGSLAQAQSAGSRSLLTIVMEILGDIPRLVRKEAELLRAELAEKAAQAGDAGMGIAIGLLLMSVALLIVLQALVLALAEAMPAWLASAIVGAIVAAIGLIMVHKGRRDLKSVGLTPQRTIDSLNDDKEILKEIVT
jgi:uncharacterized membrane protein YqjE